MKQDDNQDQKPVPEYLKKLAARREAMKNYGAYLAECERRYPGGSESQGS
jgi:hypothetical protein